MTNIVNPPNMFFKNVFENQWETDDEGYMWYFRKDFKTSIFQTLPLIK